MNSLVRRSLQKAEANTLSSLLQRLQSAGIYDITWGLVRLKVQTTTQAKIADFSLGGLCFLTVVYLFNEMYVNLYDFK